ncbi:hypothetical protein PybrP1_001420 [[Pythium] brassicae (nom. inval.)]|nr:hypothetical protein PybrP1_001420 [[Pythium] brassicae (nom. inval.)]
MAQSQPLRRRRPSRRHHRHYGLSNANQLLLVLVVDALFCFTLVRPHWLEFSAGVSAGLWSFAVPEGVAAGDANSSVRVTWSAFCDPTRSNFTLPVVDEVAQPVGYEDAKFLCGLHDGYASLPEIIRALMATAVAFTTFTLVGALYLHLGRPTRAQIFHYGAVPALALLVAAVLAMTALILWQIDFGAFDNGDCIAMTLAGTITAFLVAVSMAIRWRWPGICAVPNEQREFQNSSYRFGRRSARAPVATAPSTAAEAALPASQPLERVLGDASDPPPRVTTFRQMV